MGDLFNGYAFAGPSAGERSGARSPANEVIEAPGRFGGPYHDVVSVVAGMSPEDVSARAARLARAFIDQGVTFDLDGEERPFPLAVMPRVFPPGEWTLVALGGGAAGTRTGGLPGRRVPRRPGAPRR